MNTIDGETAGASKVKYTPKVGIVTYIRNANYGSALQAYALQNVVRSKGYDAFVIDYTDMKLEHNVNTQKRVVRDRILSSFMAPRKLFELQKARTSFVPNEQKAAIFQNFEDKYIRFSQDDYTRPDNFDVFICGSDQIWSLAVPGLNWRFFLRFAPEQKRVAYAPSFGMEEVPFYNRARLRKYLSEFPYLSVREGSGCKIIKQLTGQRVPSVLDPVLLAGADFWRSTTEVKGSPFMLCYFLSDASLALEYIEKLARKENLKIVWVQNDSLKTSDYESVIPDPLDFVSLIDAASYVCTDSFHGMAFSILFATDFSIFDRSYEANAQQTTRVDSLLELVGLPLERTDNHRDALGYASKAVNLRLEKARITSDEYLTNALAKAVNLIDYYG